MSTKNKNNGQEETYDFPDIFNEEISETPAIIEDDDDDTDSCVNRDGSVKREIPKAVKERVELERKGQIPLFDVNAAKPEQLEKLKEHLTPKEWQIENLGFYDKRIKLSRSKSGELSFMPDYIENIEIVLSNKYKIKQNMLNGIIYIDGQEQTDANFAPILKNLQNLTKCARFQDKKIMQAISIVASNSKFNPISDMIMGFVKTKEYEFERLFIDYAQVEDTQINRLMTKRFLVAAVRRALDPGSYCEGMLTLSGGQGKGKSTMFNILAVRDEFFTDDKLDFENEWKGAARIKSRWFVEFAELSTIRKSDIETVKQFLTKREDKYSDKSSNLQQTWKRSASFCGTTNRLEILSDTENRRFWVIKCGNIDLKGLRANIENIWANVRDFATNNPDFCHTFRDDQDLLTENQNEFILQDPREEAIEEYIINFPRDKYATKELMEDLKLDINFVKYGLPTIMQKLGFESKKIHGVKRWIKYRS
jgi:predicted P-loop ATPase